jgi:hypothetical protein
MDCRIDRQILTAHNDAILALDPRKSDYATQVISIARDLKDRLDWVFEPDTVFKAAAVVFFDATENPLVYSTEYAKIKIARWKAEGLLNFFLQKPIKDLIGLPTDSALDLETYLPIVEKLKMKNLLSLFERLDTGSSNNMNRQSLQSSINELRKSPIFSA